MIRVAVFTDNDFGKINGVTTALKSVLDHQPPDVCVRVYTAADAGASSAGYFAVRSPGVDLPRYPDMKVYWPRAASLSAEMRRDGVDVIHLTTPGPVGLAGRYLAWRRGLPSVGSFHTHLGEYTEVLTGSRPLGRAINRYMRWLYAACGALLAPSQATVELLAAQGHRRERLRVWSRGVDVARFSPDRRSAELRRAWGVSTRRPAILYAGRLSKEKGLDALPAIVAQLHGRSLDHRLILAGDGPMRAELERRLPGAEFLGALPHDAMGQVMASADLLLFPSATDAFGNVVLEAQACGVPVIVSDEGGPREAMLSGRTGYVCAAGRADAFADAAAILVHDPDTRRRFGQHARMFAETRSWTAALRPLFDAWRQSARGLRSPAAAGLPPVEMAPAIVAEKVRS